MRLHSIYQSFQLIEQKKSIPRDIFDHEDNMGQHGELFVQDMLVKFQHFFQVNPNIISV